jgi:glycosyltransferase involved in cell wall biosynthesis
VVSNLHLCAICATVVLGRFERKKNIGLAVEALHSLQQLLPPSDWARVKLVLAGSLVCFGSLREGPLYLS